MNNFPNIPCLLGYSPADGNFCKYVIAAWVDLETLFHKYSAFRIAGDSLSIIHSSASYFDKWYLVSHWKFITSVIGDI